MFSSLLYRTAGAASHFGRRLFSSFRIPPSQDALTVSYLINSCGLSAEAAIKASHKVNLQSLEKSISVVSLLREYEFSETQISNVVWSYPRILMADAKKTLLPKLEFFCSIIGMSRPDFAKTVCYNTCLLTRSLKEGIIPCYTFLKSVVLSDAKVVQILKHKSFIFRGNLFENIVPNVELVRELGVRRSAIVQLLSFYNRILIRKPELFSQIVAEVQEMGFDPQMSNFVLAVVALCGKETWNRCHEAYKRWGWSDDDVLSAFKLYPLCMTISEKNIMAKMDFFVNKMGWKSGKIAKYPYVFHYSLEKRIIPRCSVVRVLLSKGLIEENKLSLSWVSSTPEKMFLYRFVTRYLDQVPQLLDVYQGKADICHTCWFDSVGSGSGVVN